MNPQDEKAPEQVPPRRVLNYRGTTGGSSLAPDVYFPDKPRDLYWPIGILAAGLAIACGVLMSLRASPRDMLILVCSYVIFRILVLVLLIPLLTHAGGMAFGLLAPAVLKLTAISVVPESVVLVSVRWWGPCYGLMSGPMVGFVLASVLFTTLFEMDFSEAKLCVALTWGLSLCFYFVWWWIAVWLAALV